MPLLQSRQEFKPSCPSGGKWYSCGGGSNFVGCCSRDPCTSTGCSQGSLYAASFDPQFYGTFPDLECDGGQFYTCTGTSPPFLGCCNENACSAEGSMGCPRSNLSGAHLPNNPVEASAYSPTGGPSSTSSASASAASSPSSDSSTPVGAIAGGVAGGAVIIAIVIIIIWYRRRQKTKNNTISHPDTPAPISELPAGGSIGGKGSPLPPRYSALENSSNYAIELDGFPRKAPNNTPSELGGDDMHAELPGDDAVHELEGSTIAPSPATASSSSKNAAAARHSRGSSWSSINSATAKSSQRNPRGLAIANIAHGNRLSPRASPRSPNFPGQDDERSSVSSLPSTPRSPHTGTANYSDVSRLSPTYPPTIREDERDEGGGRGGKGRGGDDL